MNKCPYCNSEVDESNSVFILPALLKYIKKYGWGMFESDHSYPVGKQFTFDGYSATIAAKKISYDSGEVDVSDYNGDSALPQGSTYNAYIVFKVGNNYFKKTGTGDSYGDVSWDGDLIPVQVKTKTIEVFEGFA